MPKLRVIFLDFDGTLVESVGVKDAAFAALAATEPAHAEEILAYHQAHNAVLRFDKFRHIVENILGRPYTAELAADYAERFHQAVFAGLTQCPEVAGGRDFLAAAKQADIPLYLLSISPDDELRAVLRARGLDGAFAEIHAGAFSKADTMTAILRRLGLQPGQALFVGDSPEDLAAAQAAGIAFVGRFSGKPLPAPVFADMHEILSHLRETKSWPTI